MNLTNIKQDIDNLKAFSRGELPALGGLTFNYDLVGEHPTTTHAPQEQNYCGTTACAAGIMFLAPGSGYRPRWYAVNDSCVYLTASFPGDGQENFSEFETNSEQAIMAKWEVSDCSEVADLIDDVFYSTPNSLEQIIETLDDYFAPFFEKENIK